MHEPESIGFLLSICAGARSFIDFSRGILPISLSVSSVQGGGINWPVAIKRIFVSVFVYYNCMLALVDCLPLLVERKLMFLLSFTCNYVVSVRRAFSW